MYVTISLVHMFKSVLYVYCKTTFAKLYEMYLMSTLCKCLQSSLFVHNLIACSSEKDFFHLLLIICLVYHKVINDDYTRGPYVKNMKMCLYTTLLKESTSDKNYAQDTQREMKHQDIYIYTQWWVCASCGEQDVTGRLLVLKHDY